MLRLLAWTLMVVSVGVIYVGCGRPDIPVWAEDDARAHLRDYLISVAEDSPYQDSLLYGIVTGASEFRAVYKADGWWEVSGEDLGRDTRLVTPTPTPKVWRGRGAEPISDDVLDSLLGRRSVPLQAPTPTPGPSPTPAPTPKPVPIGEFSEGVWLVSERTGSVMPKNSAAESFHWCLVTAGKDRALKEILERIGLCPKVFVDP